MDNNEPNRDRPDNESTLDEYGDQESLALGPFILAVSECAGLLAGLKERVNDHLGVPPDGVTWGRVADADRLLYHLRHAAFVAGMGEEPLL